MPEDAAKLVSFDIKFAGIYFISYQIFKVGQLYSIIIIKNK